MEPHLIVNMESAQQIESDNSSCEDMLEDSKTPQDAFKRSSFIMPPRHMELPELWKQKSDTTLSKKGINIFVRFRPDNLQETSAGQSCVTYHPDNKTVTIEGAGKSHQFKFKKIFPAESTQEQVFLSCALPLVDKILDGYNSAIIAYGQTGAGKTHSLLGPSFDSAEHSNEDLRGVAPRLIESLFHQIFSSISGDVIYRVYASYIQIYLEKIYDLLSYAKKKLTVYQDISKGLWVTDATKVPVKDVKEVLNLLEQGSQYRVTAPTLSNSHSSRSHALLILTVSKHMATQGVYRASQVYITDLCGSERIAKTGVEEMRLTEAQNINKSLLSLGQVIAALAQKKAHIPYRNSKLTRLLQNCFGGNSLTSLLLCCSSNSTNVLESLSTLRFGDRASLVHNAPIINQRESVEDLRRMLNEANAKNFSLQRVVRGLNEKSIELSILVQDLYGMVRPEQRNLLQYKYQITFPETQQNDFSKLGSSVFSYLICFLLPTDVIRIFGTCKMFNERLKSDTIWKFYLHQLQRGNSYFEGVEQSMWPEIEEVPGSIWEAIQKVVAQRHPRDLEPVTSGLHLFPNLNSGLR